MKYSIEKYRNVSRKTSQQEMFRKFYDKNIGLIGKTMELMANDHNFPDLRTEYESACNFAFWRAWRTFDPRKAKASTYFIRCMLNACLMIRNSYIKDTTRNRSAVSIDAIETRYDETTRDFAANAVAEMATDGGISDVVGSCATSDAYNKVIAEASARDKQIAHMCFIKNMRQVDVAKILGVSQAFVSDHLAAMRKSIRNELELSEPAQARALGVSA